MPDPSHDPSVFHEPHMRPAGKPTSLPGAVPGEHLADEHHEDQLSATGQSIHEEPDIFPDRKPEVLKQDWSCSRCGYNLRGLEAGHLCPECGHRELYRPAPPGSASYAGWLAGKLAESSPRAGWFTAAMLALAGGPLAVLAALFKSGQTGVAGLSTLVLAVVFGPAAEETLKIASASCVLEVKPYLFRRAGQIRLATVGAAFLFAAIENLIYLNVYLPNPSLSLVLWRWTVCVALHTGCTLLASNGLIRVWNRTITELRPPQLSDGLPELAWAIVIHGFYNLVAIFFEFAAR
ncbi:MAG: PrsW family glutamic-type intramembrane protease [Phycisphaerae bacterium]